MLKRADWPFGTKPPWDIDQVIAWRERTLNLRDGAIVDEIKRAELGLKKHKLKVLTDAYVPRQQYEDALDALATVFVDSLGRLEANLPYRLANRPPGEIATELAEAFDDARRHILNGKDRELTITTTKRKRRVGRPIKGSAGG